MMLVGPCKGKLETAQGELLQPRACLEDLSAEVNYKTEITQHANLSPIERNTGGVGIG